MKGQKKKQNGITLIALVISIIVMLILAGVSINALMGDNGILKQAQFASFMSEMAAVEEAVQLWGADHYDDENHSIPAKGIVPESEIDGSERLGGEIGYYRTWSRTNTMPATPVMAEASSFNSTYLVEMVSYPGGIEDLYYLDNDGLNLSNNKKYVIDAENSMVYSVQGISLNGVRCYSLAMAKAVMNGTYDVPSFASAEVSGTQVNGGQKLAGNSRYKLDENGKYLLDENGEMIENEEYDDNGFQIIGDYTNSNIYKLYNNGDLYAKGVKGNLLNTSSTDMDKIDNTLWQKLVIPSEIPGYNTSGIKLYAGNGTVYVVDTNKELWAWGDNSYNKLGLSQDEQVEYTGMVATKLNVDGKKIYKVIPSATSTYVITETNGSYELYASGRDAYGELGINKVMENTDKFYKVEFDNPQNIINITWCGNDNRYTLILYRDASWNKIYFAGDTSVCSGIFNSTDKKNQVVSKFIEILNNSYGSKLETNIVNIYSYDPTWWGTGSIKFIMFGANKNIYIFNQGNISELKFNSQSANYSNYYIGPGGYFIIRNNTSGDKEFWAYNQGNGPSAGIESRNVWTEVSNIYDASLFTANILDVSATDGNIYFLCEGGKVYGVGKNSGLGIGENTGYSKIWLNDSCSNFKSVNAFIKDENGLSGNGTFLLETSDGLYATGNSTILFREEQLQKNWTKIAQNVKKFSAKTFYNSLAYIDYNNDLWVLGDYASYFGLDKLDGNVSNFVLAKNYISDTTLVSKISGNCKDFCCTYEAFYVVTNGDDNNTLYVCAPYKSVSYPAFPEYTRSGLEVDAPILTSIMGNVRLFNGAYLSRFAITKDNKLYIWGHNDSQLGVYASMIPKLYEGNLISSSNINKIVGFERQTFLIENSTEYNKVYNIGYASVTSAGYCNGFDHANSEWGAYDIENDFGAERIVDIAGADTRSTFCFLTQSGNLYGFGMKNRLGIGSSSTGLQNNPITISQMSDVTQIVGGNGWFVCIKKDGSVWGTGSNQIGILGRWIGIDRNSPNSRYKTAFNWVECPELEI